MVSDGTHRRHRKDDPDLQASEDPIASLFQFGFVLFPLSDPSPLSTWCPWDTRHTCLCLLHAAGHAAVPPSPVSLVPPVAVVVREHWSPKGLRANLMSPSSMQGSRWFAQQCGDYLLQGVSEGSLGPAGKDPGTLMAVTEGKRLCNMVEASRGCTQKSR